MENRPHVRDRSRKIKRFINNDSECQSQSSLAWKTLILCTNKLFQSPGKRLQNQDKDLLNEAIKNVETSWRPAETDNKARD